MDSPKEPSGAPAPEGKAGNPRSAGGKKILWAVLGLAVLAVAALVWFWFRSPQNMPAVFRHGAEKAKTAEVMPRELKGIIEPEEYREIVDQAERAASEASTFPVLERDLFVLEFLREDNGKFDSFERLSRDLETAFSLAD